MIDAQALVRDVATDLQDADGVRWPADDLVGYLNDGQRFIVEKSPTATGQEATITLAAGVMQAVPPEARALLDVLRNIGGRQTAITQVARSALDASAPNWAAGRTRPTIYHFIADARTPRAFEVYPPADAGTQVLAVLSMEPVDAPAPSGPTAADVSGNLSLRAEYRNALRHYALYRAWSKDAEGASNPDLAKAHLDLCVDALGLNTGHPNVGTDTSN